MRLILMNTSRGKIMAYFPQSEAVEFVEPTESEIESVRLVYQDEDWLHNYHVIECEPELMAEMLFLMLIDSFPPNHAFELH